MSDNPWLTPVQEPAPEPVAPAPRPWAPGADVAAVPGLPVAAVEQAPGGGLWVVGAHGGAGASTLAALLGAGDAGRCWPLDPSGRTRVVVAARTSAYGIGCAQEAAMQWAAGGAPPGTELLAVAWVADAPGRLPRALAKRLGLVSGAFPVAVRVPWVGAWRVGGQGPLPVPKNVWRSLSALPQMREET